MPSLQIRKRYLDCFQAERTGPELASLPSRFGRDTASVADPADRNAPDKRSPMAIAFEWSATIMTLSAEMVVPGLLGYLVDQWLGTRVVFLLLGFALGGTLAGLGLMRIAKGRDQRGGVSGYGKRSKPDSEA